MGRALVVGMLIVLAVGCSSSKTTAPTTVAGHSVDEFASVVAQGKVDVQRAIDDRGNCVETDVGSCDALAKQLGYDSEYGDAINGLVGALQKVGAPEGRARPLVTSTLRRLKVIFAATSAWVACVNRSGGSDGCASESDAYDAATPDFDRVIASWQPYL